MTDARGGFRGLIGRRPATALALTALSAAILSGAASAQRELASQPAEAATVAAGPQPGLVFTSTRTGIAQAYGYDVARRSLVQLTFPRWGLLSTGAAAASLAPNGSMLLVTGDGGTIVSAGGTRTIPFGKAAEAPWSRDSRTLLGTTICGPPLVADAEGGSSRQVGTGVATEPAWSPNSRQIAFLHATTCATDGPRALAVVPASPGGAVRALTPADAAAGTPAWSPDGRLLALVRGDGAAAAVWIVPASGGGMRRVSAAGAAGPVRWSPDGRWLAFRRAGRVEVVRPDGRNRRTPARAAMPAAGRSGTALAWSPQGLLAIAGGNGLRVYDPAARRLRVLDAQPVAAPAWRWDSALLAYEAKRTHALRVVGLRGRPRTLHTFASTSMLGSLQWVRRQFPGQPPEPVQLLERRREGGIDLRAPVSELAVNGDEVAFLACGNVVGVWNPPSGSVEYPLPEWARRPLTRYGCVNPAWQSMGTSWLALSRLGLAYWRSAGGITRFWSLLVGAPTAVKPVNSWYTTLGGPPKAGWTRAEGNLLVFATREVVHDAGKFTVASQTIWRVEGNGYNGTCPLQRYTWETEPGRCRRLATATGELLPLDVQGGRIAVLRADGTVAVIDGEDGHTVSETAEGRQPAVDAALSGRDLVVLRRGTLSRHDAATGALLNAWPLSKVETGRHCNAQEWDCVRDVRLRLEDAARGLAAYTVDGRLHVLRLVDGHDRDTAAASRAGFVDSGLVYASPQPGEWSTRLTFVPDAALR